MLSTLVSFGIRLEDKLSPAAKQAQASVSHLTTQLRTGKTQLAAYQAQLARAKELGNVEGYRKYSALVQTSRQSVFDLTQSLEGMGGATGQATAGLSSMGNMASFASGTIGILAAAAVAAGAAIIGTVVDLTGKLTKFALETVNTNDRLRETFEALGSQGPGSGKKTLAMLDALSSKLPQSRAELAGWTKQLEAMGITDLGELRGQLYATAAAQAIMGDEGAEAYQKLTQRVRLATEAHTGLKLGVRQLVGLYKSGVDLSDVAGRMGMSVTALTTQLKAGTVDAQKFGIALETSLIAKGKGPLAAMGSSLETLKAKGKEAFAHLFDGIDIKPITDGLKGFIGLLDQGKPSGQQFKAGVTSGIQGVVKWLGKMLVEGQVMFLTLELWGVKHRGTLHRLEDGFGRIGGAIVKTTGFLSELFALSPPPWLMRLIAGIGTLGGTEIARALMPSAPGGPTAPAHARGGLVGRPAPGEAFASVAPGEMILPRQMATMLRGGIGGGMGLGGGLGFGRSVGIGAGAGAGFGGGMGAGMGMGAPMFPRREHPIMGRAFGSFGREMFRNVANNNAGERGGGGVHIDHLELTIQAPNGVTDATSLSVTGLSLALERYKLASGR